MAWDEVEVEVFAMFNGYQHDAREDMWGEIWKQHLTSKAAKVEWYQANKTSPKVKATRRRYNKARQEHRDSDRDGFREYHREYMRKRRASMTDEQRERVNARRRELRKRVA